MPTWEGNNKMNFKGNRSGRSGLDWSG